MLFFCKALAQLDISALSFNPIFLAISSEILSVRGLELSLCWGFNIPPAWTDWVSLPLWPELIASQAMEPVLGTGSTSRGEQLVYILQRKESSG